MKKFKKNSKTSLVDSTEMDNLHVENLSSEYLNDLYANNNGNHRRKKTDRYEKSRENNKDHTSNFLKGLSSMTTYSNELNESKNYRQKENDQFYERIRNKIRIRLKVYIENICFKLHQSNKDNILTLNLFDINYYFFMSLYNYQYYFHKFKKEITFYLNDKVEQIELKQLPYVNNREGRNSWIQNKKELKTVHRKKKQQDTLELENQWYNVTSSNESYIEEKKLAYRKLKKKKNCIKMSLQFKINLLAYDTMYNTQDTIINPFTVYLYVNERYEWFPILYVQMHTTSININITTSLLCLCQFLFKNMNLKRSVTEKTNNYIKIYNDLHFEIIIFYKSRTKDNNYLWRLVIIDKNEYHEFPCEVLYFCINKKKEKKSKSALGPKKGYLDDPFINSQQDLNILFNDIYKLGIRKRNIYSMIAKEESHLLYDNTENVYNILYRFTYNMPFLHNNYDNYSKIINIIKKKSSWVYIGALYTDDLYSRAYKIPNMSYNLLVEPEMIRNKWCMCISSCIQLENNTGLTFRIYKEGKAKYFARVNFKWTFRKKEKRMQGQLKNWSDTEVQGKSSKQKKRHHLMRKNKHKYNEENDNNEEFTKTKDGFRNRDHSKIEESLNYMNYVYTKKKKGRGKEEDYIDVAPYSKRAIPLFWLYNYTLPYIKIIRKNENKFRLKPIRDHYNKESFEFEAVPFYILHKLFNEYAMTANNNSYGKQLHVSPSELIFKGLIMFYCYVNIKDVPTQHIKETSYNYSVVIEPMVAIKNQLPYPITVIVRLKNEKGLLNFTKSKYEDKEMEDHVFNKKSYEQEDDLTKILKRKELFALVLPQHYWYLPISAQAISLKIFYHGLQIEKMNCIAKYINQLNEYFDFDNIQLPDLNMLLPKHRINTIFARDDGNQYGPRSTCRLYGRDDLKNQVNFRPCHNEYSKYDHLLFNNMNNNNYSSSNSHSTKNEPNYQNDFLYVTDGFLPVYMPTNDTITTTKTLYHKYGTISSIFTYDELKIIYFENKISQLSRKIYDNLHMFKTINIAADVSRRKIELYFPFFFENTTNVCICISKKILPSNSRLYLTEEEAKNIKIKSYKLDHINNRILCSTLSSKIDCTKTNIPRPLINLVYHKINRKQKVRFGAKNGSPRNLYRKNVKKHLELLNTQLLVLSDQKKQTRKEKEAITERNDQEKRKLTEGCLLSSEDGRDPQYKKTMKQREVAYENFMQYEKYNKKHKAEKKKKKKSSAMGRKKKDTLKLNDWSLEETNASIKGQYNKYDTDKVFLHEVMNQRGNGKGRKDNSTSDDISEEKNEKKLDKTITKKMNKEKEKGKKKKKKQNFDKLERLDLFHMNKSKDTEGPVDETYRSQANGMKNEDDNESDLIISNANYFMLDFMKDDKDSKKKLKKKKRKHQIYKGVSRKRDILLQHFYSIGKRKIRRKQQSCTIKKKKKKKFNGFFRNNEEFSSCSASTKEKFHTASFSLRNSDLYNLFKEDSVSSNGLDDKEDTVLRESYGNEDTGEYGDIEMLSSINTSTHNLKYKKRVKPKKGRRFIDFFRRMKYMQSNEHIEIKEYEKPSRSSIFKSKLECYEENEGEYTPKSNTVKHQFKINERETIDGAGEEIIRMKLAEERKSTSLNFAYDENSHEEKLPKGKNYKSLIDYGMRIRDKKKWKRKIKRITRKYDYHEQDCLSVGICVRYAEEPFNKSKIVSFVNRYIFINRLPFDIKIERENTRKGIIDPMIMNTALRVKATDIPLEDSVSRMGDLNNGMEEEKKKTIQIHDRDKSMAIMDIASQYKFEDKGKNELQVPKDKSYYLNTFMLETKTGPVATRRKSTDLTQQSDITRISKIITNQPNHANTPNFQNSQLRNKGRTKNVFKIMDTEYMNHEDSSEGATTNHRRDASYMENDDFLNDNETVIRKGEIVSFHSLRSHVKIKDIKGNYISLPFSLIPKHVPTNFQIELFHNTDGVSEDLMNYKLNSSTYADWNKSNNLLVEVNICSGLFGDRQELPYAYNGYFYILSLPLRPQFEIINTSRFIIAYVTDFNKSTRKYINQNYSFDPSSSNNKNLNSFVKMVYPYSCIYYTLANNDEIENSKIALKIVGVQKSSWCINPINSFIDQVMTIPYSIYGRTSKKKTNKKNVDYEQGGVGEVVELDRRNKNGTKRLNATTKQIMPLKRSHQLSERMSNVSDRLFNGKRQSVVNPLEIPKPDFSILSPRDHTIFDFGNEEESKKRKRRKQKRNISYGGGEDADEDYFLGHNLVNKKLFSFLIIRDNGSRAIVITENYKMARKVVNTKNFSTIHKFIAINKMKKIIMNQENRNRRFLLDYKIKDFIYFNFPNFPILYNFSIPQMTFTWIHRHNVIIAMYLTKLKYTGHIHPKELINDDLNQMFTPINILKKKQILEYMQYVFLNSYIDSVFLIEQIHMDHFVKGDIPVILKNTYIEGNEKKDIFLYIHIKQYCVDVFKQAPMYRGITIKISPINANIELLVVEQLIEIVEKERKLLMTHENKDKTLPPVINTSKTAQNAINTTLKLFSNPHFLNVLYMNEHITDCQGGTPLMIQNGRVTNKKLVHIHKNNTTMKIIESSKRKNAIPPMDLSSMPRHQEGLHIPGISNEPSAFLDYNGKKNIYGSNQFPSKSTKSNDTNQKDSHFMKTREREMTLFYHNYVNKSQSLQSKSRRRWNELKRMYQTNTCGNQHNDEELLSNEEGNPSKCVENYLDPFMNEDDNMYEYVDKKYKSLNKKLSKILIGYYKYKKINDLINNSYYNINTMNDETMLPIKLQFFKNHRIFMKTFSSHIFLHPNPKWIENKTKPVYIREFKIYPIDIIASIRTSEHRISRKVLHIVDALPLDTPSMRIHLLSQKRSYIVCTWDDLFRSLRFSYFRQLFRQSLPSAWLSNPFALITGFIKGLHGLFKECVRGVRTNSNVFDGFMSGLKCGIIILVVNTVGGLFQSISHMLNVCHKLMGGSRPRPPSILDALMFGLEGFVLDTFYRPWVALITEPKVSINKGNSTLKTICILFGCIIRCLFAPLFGLLNFLTSLTEGFANTLIGDFERFSRIQERAEFETEHLHRRHYRVKKKKKKMKKMMKNMKRSLSTLRKSSIR